MSSRAIAAAAHVLYKHGAEALKPRGKGLPPLISHADAMQLREMMYQEGQVWPFEKIVPGVPAPPVGAEAYLKRKQEKELKKQQRLKEIQEAMAKMPQMIAAYRATRKLDWASVAPVDKLTMTKTAIRQKYLRNKLAKL